jgi:hypothetical protein
MPELCQYNAVNVSEMWELNTMTEQTEARLTADTKMEVAAHW